MNWDLHVLGLKTISGWPVLTFYIIYVYIFVFFNYLYLFLTAFKNSALIYNNRNDFITWPIEDLHPNWLEYLGHFLKQKLEDTWWHCKQKMMSSTNEDNNEDLEKSDTISESKLFHSESAVGSTWPFKTRRRSSNDSRLMLLGGK